MRPQLGYAMTRRIRSACQVVGSGPIDRDFVMGWVFDFDTHQDEPRSTRGGQSGLSTRSNPDNLHAPVHGLDDVRQVSAAYGGNTSIKSTQRCVSEVT